MAVHRQSTNTLHGMPMQFDQTCMSLLVASCECPVCHDVVKPPTKMCLAGHICCMACVLDSPSCPLCKERFSCVHLSVMERLLKIVGCACRHARYGCLEFLENERRADHERHCGWRKVQCVWCNTVPGVNQWAEHVVEKHGSHTLSYETEGQEAIPQNTEVAKSLFYINGVMFCLFLTKGDGDGPLYMTIQCFPTSREDMNTVFEAYIENNGLYFCQSILPISDAVRRSDVFKDLDKCVIIPCYLLKQKKYFSFKITMSNMFKNTMLCNSKLPKYEKNKLSF